MSYHVPADAEFCRIATLPRRSWAPGEAARLAEALSPEWLTAEGLRLWRDCAGLQPDHRERELRRLAQTGMPIRLKPEQAMMLTDFRAAGGLLGAAPVGAGKTLAAWLCAVAAWRDGGIDASVLLEPAMAVPQVRQDFAGFRRVWQSAPNPPTLVTYQALGLPGNVGLLCDCHECLRGYDGVRRGGLRPVLLMGDEASLLRNPGSAVSKRVGRYVAKHLPVCAWFTGTPRRLSIRDLARPIIWALKDAAPVPLSHPTMVQWRQALDAKQRDPGVWRDPGALMQWAGRVPADASYETRRELANAAVGQRIADTPGVVVVRDGSCHQPLIVRVVSLEDPILDSAFAQFRATDETLDGWRLGDPLSVLRHGTELGCGFYYRWDPRPPADWVAARSAWNRLVAEKIADSQHSRCPLDSEGAVARMYRDHPVYRDWTAIRPTFEPTTVPVPVSIGPLTWARDWIAENSPALIWVQHDWVGQTLAQLTGVPYYSTEGKSAAGEPIGVRATPERARKSAILSAHANRYNRNLQGYCRNLVIGPEHSAERWEQMLGRSHRFGQECPVECTILVACAENVQALQAAQFEAREVFASTRMAQKILDAAWDWGQCATHAVEPASLDITDARRPRWTPRQR